MYGHSFGIMQGRLTPSLGRGIQFFPFDNWENEFTAAASLGLDEIEFIFDFDGYERNPLWSDEGTGRISDIVRQTGVRVNHICADFFMRRPFFRVNEDIRDGNIEVLKKLAVQAEKIGAKTVEIPMVDNSSIKTEEEKDILIEALKSVFSLIEEKNVVLTLETDLPPKLFLELLKRVNHPLVKANYDSGNSSGLGYNPEEEVMTLGPRIHNIHIKDRLLGGATVPLGAGSADFDRLFEALNRVGYAGSFILQAARGSDGDEINAVKNYMEFVKGYLRKYGFRIKK